ncbi:class Ia ribonucleotide reductase alpha subunit [Faustovirus]|nr:class Ia ribonucleotide reductase alpha subunit [Faustovirus]AMN84493.1 class Ia ribonucleotide reductase alpha subunit [Faustovirus]AMP44365.1 ribonucleotidereductase of class Ia alpha subunit [Faustovirus]
MQVIKRDGRTEGVDLNKITNRIRLLCNDLSTTVDPVKISVETVRNINDMIKTTELDNISASIAEGHKMIHPDYSILASRIYISNMHKSTPATFSESLELIHEKLGSIRKEVFDFVADNSAAINAMIDNNRDHNYGYLALLKLVQSYLDHEKFASQNLDIRKLLDRPQYMLMRVALGFYYNYPCGLDKKLELIKATYDDLSLQLYTHATPTLYNSSKQEQQMLSCFPPDALVATVDGVKRIADIAIGDVVFTHNGIRSEVLQTHVNRLGDREFVSVKVAGTPAFVCTHDHKFRVRDVDRNGQVVYVWKRAIDLCTGADKMAIPIDTRASQRFIEWRTLVDINGVYENTHTRLDLITTPRIEDEVRVVNSIPVNVELMQLIASWLCADNTDPSRVVFKARMVDDQAVKRLILTIKKLFGATPTILGLTETKCLLVIYSGALHKLLCSLFAVNDAGVFGMLSNADIKQVCDQIAYTLSEPSAEIQRDLFYLTRARGVSCEFTDDGKFTIPHMEYECANNHRLYPVESVEILTDYKINNQTANAETLVYTLGVEESHSYMVNGVIAKNCFLLGVNDSIESIMETVSKASKISKWSGGIGVHYSKIRARGQLIRGTNGRSSGIIPQLRIWDACANTWDQGGDKRKGSIAVYLEPWHADICEFLELKLQNGADELRARNLFYAVWMNDLFMRRVEQDANWSLFSEDTAPGLSTTYDSMENGYAFTRLYEQYEREGRAVRVMKAKDLRDRIITTQMETGVPYIAYKDAANRKTNQSNIGVITGSNLCVAPETMILTDRGYFPIKSLAGQHVNVWNGDEFTDALVAKTSENQPLIRVSLSNGVDIDCTPYHKFILPDGTEIEASQLQPGNKLIKYELPTIREGIEFPYAYTHGVFCGDGTYENSGEPKPCEFNSLNGEGYCNRHIDYKKQGDLPSAKCQAISNMKLPRITLYDEKRVLEPILAKRIPSCFEENGRINVKLPIDIAQKYFVPINYNLASKVAWFAGLCDADGCVVKQGASCAIQLSSVELNFLREIKLMLQTIGIDSKITKMHDAKMQMMPDGHGGQKEYMRQTCYRLLISSKPTQKLLDLGFNPRRLVINRDNRNTPNTSQYIKITQVVDLGRRDDTYCFNEPKLHRGMFNGVLAGNCAEIYEVCSADSFACCTLASINVKKYLEKLTYDNGKQITTEWRYNYRRLWEAVRRVARNLDIVIDINSYPVKECVDNNSKYRPIGIGIQGLADLFCIMRIPYLSDLASEIDVNIAATIYHAALTESCARATVFGKYEGFDGSPAAQGRLQYHMWGVATPAMSTAPMHGYDDFKLDWPGLIAEIKARGLRNSLTVAYMPTASTSILLGNNESFEPYTSNIYSINGLTGKQTTCNVNMIYHLIELGLWNESMSKIIGNNRGSIQSIKEIPDSVKEIYKTVWELSQTRLLERSQARGAYIDQGESHNVFIEAPTAAKYRTIMRKGFELGLKTGSYYIRTRPAAEAIKNNTLTSQAMTTAVSAQEGAIASAAVPETRVEQFEEQFDGPACGRGGCSG